VNRREQNCQTLDVCRAVPHFNRVLGSGGDQ
jgi:hypothetical protein